MTEFLFENLKGSEEFLKIVADRKAIGKCLTSFPKVFETCSKTNQALHNPKLGSRGIIFIIFVVIIVIIIS